MKFSWLTIVAPRVAEQPRDIRAGEAAAEDRARRLRVTHRARGLFYQSRPRRKSRSTSLGASSSARSVRGVGLVGAPEAAQEVGARRVEEVVVVEALDRVDEREPCSRPVGHRDGDGAVQLDDRRRREVEQPA